MLKGHVEHTVGTPLRNRMPGSLHKEVLKAPWEITSRPVPCRSHVEGHGSNEGVYTVVISLKTPFLPTVVTTDVTIAPTAPFLINSF